MRCCALAGLVLTLAACHVGTRIIVPTFPMCEAGAEPTYDIAEDGQGTAIIGGRPYRVGFDLEPLQLTPLLLKLPPDPTVDAPPPAKTGDVFISTMQMPSTPVSASLQRRRGGPPSAGQWNGDYAAALYIVSQVVEEHDFEGLRSLWYAVPMGASASEFRDAYRSIFGQPIDHLVEPKMIGPVPATRLSCFYEICLQPPQPLDASGQWQGRGPAECDDPATIGPRAAAGEVTAWTHQVVELPANASLVTLVGGTGAVVRTCGFGCNAVVHDARIEPGAAVDLALPAGTYLVEIGESIDRLRHEDEAVLTLGSAD